MLTIIISVISFGRSFSKLKIINFYLRSTIFQLNKLILLSIKKRYFK